MTTVYAMTPNFAPIPGKNFQETRNWIEKSLQGCKKWTKVFFDTENDNSSQSLSSHNLLPRFIRFRDAPYYLGMDKNRFSAEVRPYLIEFPIGIQGIAFDRLDLDRWAEQYKARNGRPGQSRGDRLWDAEKRPDYKRRASSGTSTKLSEGSELQNLLAQAGLRKQKNT